MALIGTISGSVGAGGSLVSATAISGTLIIADAPPSSFPAIQSGVKLFVSGNKTALGADTPNTIFGGDTFVSGAFGTDSYVQMKPVNTLRVPTNTTASYIYTSGSTNDMYFTQYSGPYTNTTRLRWLESNLTTGLLHGGVLSTTNGTTTFSITAGSGIVVSQNASTTTDPYPTIVLAKWATQTDIPLTYVATNKITYVYIDSTGAVQQSASPVSYAEDASYIVVGRILHQEGNVTNGAVTNPIVSYGGTQYLNDFVQTIGPLKISGHVVSRNATPSSTGPNVYLGLAKTSGDAYVQGKNYTTNPSSPNVVTSTTDTAVTTSKIYREYVNASGNAVINTNAGVGFTAIDPTQYTLNGTLTTVTNNNKFTVQRVFWYPNSASRAFTVYYGGAEYDSLDAGQLGIQSEAFVEGPNSSSAAILVAYIIVRKSCTDLDTAADARIVTAGTFRAIGGGGSSTLAAAGADTYVQYNNAGGFGGSSTLRFISTTGTTYSQQLVVSGTTDGSLVSSGSIQVKSGAGAVVANISTDGIISGSSDLQIGGNITGSNVLLRGDLAVNGGDITSTATLNISAGTSGLAFQQSGTSFATFVSGASGPLQLVTLQASSGKSLVLAAGLGSTAPTPQVTVSGSYIDIRSSNSGTPSGVDFSNDVGGNPSSYLNITSGSYVPLGSTVSLNAAKITAASSRDLVLGAPSGQKVFVSGSTVTLNGGAAGVSIQRDAAEILQVSSPGSPQVSITPGAGYTTANLFNTTTTTLNVGGAATTVSIGASTGRTTVNNDLAIATGNIIGAPGAGNNVMTLISSGNIIARLDTDASAAGHKFAVRDWRDIDQFSVGEDGNAEVSGSFVVSGSTTFGSTVERLLTSVGSTGTVSFDTTFSSIFYVNNPAGDILANFTNVPTTNNNRVVTTTVILSQSATARIVNGVQVNGTSGSILWANKTTPTGTANQQDVFGFSLIRSGSIWTILGQMSTYG